MSFVDEAIVGLRRGSEPDDGNLPDLDLVDIYVTPPLHRPSGWECLLKWLRKCRFWKFVSTLLVSTAFDCSITVLGICTLVTVQSNNNNEPALHFGLWSYSEANETSLLSSSLAMDCIPYTKDENTGTFANGRIVMDAPFRTARVFGVLSVCVGFLTMAALWIGVLRDYDSTTPWRRWVGGSLLLCGFGESMTLLVLTSHVCQTGCSLGTGYAWVVAGTVLWFASGVVLVKWPRAEYRHFSLAMEEDPQQQRNYPERVVDDDDALSGMWRSFSDETTLVEMTTRFYNEETPQLSSSLRNLMSGFDSELHGDLNSSMDPSLSKNGQVNVADFKNHDNHDGSSSPQRTMERLRHQSEIQSSQSVHTTPNTTCRPKIQPQIPPNVQGSSRHDLKSMLDDAFDDDDDDKLC